jgi:hypothetical protein
VTLTGFSQAGRTSSVTASRRLLVAVLLVTALKAACVVVLFRTPVSAEDGVMAANFATTGSFFINRYGIDNHTFQFPVYMTLVGWTYRLFGEHRQLACLLNVLLSGLTACVLIPLFSRILDEIDPQHALPGANRTAVVSVAVLGFLFHPFTSYYAMNNIHPFSLDLLMLYVPLLLMFRYVDRGERPIDLLLLALSLGVVLLTRTTLVVGMLLFLRIVGRRSGWKAAIVRASIATTIAVLMSVPWLIRNYRIDGIVGYTSTTGENIWKGALDNSEGANYLADGSNYRTVLTTEELDLLPTLSVNGQNEFFLDKYRRILVERPGHIAEMFLRKLRNFFWFRPGIGERYNAVMQRVMPLYMAMYAVALALALLSIPAFGRSTLVFWSIIAALGMFQSVFYVETRHRVVIEPLLILLAAASTSVLVSSFRSRRVADATLD